MSDVGSEQPGLRKAPWHLWLVGVLSLLWNAAGAWTIMSAQSGAPMDMDATEIAYYAAQPAWLVALTDIALISAVLAAIALLLQDQEWLILEAVTLGLAILQLLYAVAMRKKGVLR